MAGITIPLRYGGIAQDDLSTLAKNRFWFGYNNKYTPTDLPTGASANFMFMSLKDYYNDVYIDIVIDSVASFYYRTSFFGSASEWKKITMTTVS